MSLHDDDILQRRIGAGMILLSCGIVVLTVYGLLSWAGVF